MWCYLLSGSFSSVHAFVAHTMPSVEACTHCEVQVPFMGPYSGCHARHILKFSYPKSKDDMLIPRFFCFCVHFCLIWIWERRNKFYHLKSSNPRALGLLGSCFILTDWCLHIIDLLPLSTLREDRLYSLENQNRQDGYDIGTFLTYLSYSLVAIALHEKNEDTG